MNDEEMFYPGTIPKFMVTVDIASAELLLKNIKVDRFLDYRKNKNANCGPIIQEVKMVFLNENLFQLQKNKTILLTTWRFFRKTA